MKLQDRPPQNRVVAEMLAHLQRGARGVVLEASTGFGKTECFTRVIHDRVNDSWRCAVFVHRETLMQQASERLTAYGIPHGLIAPGHELCVGDTVWVVMIAAATARIHHPEYRRWIGTLDLVIIDECHRAVADSYARIIAMLRGQMIGASATCWRLDGRGLGEVGFDRVVRAPPMRKLIEMGYLAPFVVIAPPMPDFDRAALRMTAGEINQADAQAAMDTDDRLVAMVRHYNRFAGGLPAFGFATGIVHAERMAETFRRFNWPSVSVSGETDDVDISGKPDGALARLARSDLLMVSSALKLIEGVDVPAVSAVIDEAPTASTQRYVQRVGRCLRTHADKTQAVILDTCGNSAVHGLPDAERQWTLEGGVKGLERQVEPTSRCIRCWRVHPYASKCPGCGLGYPKAKGDAPATVWHLPSIGGVRPEVIAGQTLGEAMKLARSRKDLERLAEMKGVQDRKWVDRMAKHLGLREAAE